MEQLIEKLNEYKKRLGNQYNLTDEHLNELYSVYPFNKFEYVISHLLAKDIIGLDEYIDLRQEYLSRNKFLYIFEITAPRTFGENWAQNHLNELVQELERPTTKLDPNYSGEYDFWYNNIKIEVKASRAVKKQSGESLVDKALVFDSKERFDMNFQQIKPSCCSVFVWIGVWRDSIKYWVLSSNEVETSKYFSHGQHRGNIGEGQLWITEKNIKDFDCYLVDPKDILKVIINKSNI